MSDKKYDSDIGCCGIIMVIIICYTAVQIVKIIYEK